MNWITVTDANGNDFPALTENGSLEEVEAWVFFNKASGFGNDVGSVALHKGLKKRADGKYGA